MPTISSFYLWSANSNDDCYRLCFLIQLFFNWCVRSILYQIMAPDRSVMINVDQKLYIIALMCGDICCVFFSHVVECGSNFLVFKLWRLYA